MDGWIVRVAWNSLQFISKANGICKRNYLFGMNIMEEIFENRSCTEMLVNEIKIHTTDQYLLQIIKNYRTVQGIYNGGSSSF